MQVFYLKGVVGTMTNAEFKKIKECIKYYEDIIGEDLTNTIISDIEEEIDIESEVVK